MSLHEHYYSTSFLTHHLFVFSHKPIIHLKRTHALTLQLRKRFRAFRDSLAKKPTITEICLTTLHVRTSQEFIMDDCFFQFQFRFFPFLWGKQQNQHSNNPLW